MKQENVLCNFFHIYEKYKSVVSVHMFQAPNCYVLNCPGPATVKGLMIDQGKHTYDIYVAVDIPKMNLKLGKFSLCL